MYCDWLLQATGSCCFPLLSEVKFQAPNYSVSVGPWLVLLRRGWGEVLLWTACAPTKFIRRISSVMVSGGEAFGSQLGREGGAPKLSAL